MQVLADVVEAFSRLPYENITKIIKKAEYDNPEKARRYPEEVIGNHIQWGAGGTCFSLTTALLHLIRCLGWNAEYILADRNYGQNTHCALLVWIDTVPHLLDPGYLITEPVPLPGKEEMQIQACAQNLILVPGEKRLEVHLSTERKGQKTYRLTYKMEPVDNGEFQKAWDASFDWEMMHYPLLVATADERQKYLRGPMLQINDGVSTNRRKIPLDALIAQIAEEFHLHPSLVAQAISILKHGGMLDGKTAGS